MRHKLLPLVQVLLAILTVFTATVHATDLRGRIDGLNPYTQTMGPLPGVRVALFVNQSGTFVLVRQAVSGSDGMYYVTGVRPGQYVLQLAGINYPLEVGAAPSQDIPIIRR
jgi:hypothetical protein